ncbi:MAG TPA: serine/threonine-protein kinase [Polyangiaceae bacterium]
MTEHFLSRSGAIEPLLRSTPYRVVARLGQGAMSEVYTVEHEDLGRLFALKVLHARYGDDPQALDRLRLEAQAAARLTHPNIVEVTDFWIAADGTPCLVMEHLYGNTLAVELERRSRLTPGEAVYHEVELLSALGAAHALGIVHRDIKPENLFLHQAAGRKALKVLDFGLARVLPRAQPDAPAPLVVPTDTGVVVGSPRFLSPEAARGEHVDHRADLYAAGLVLYLMLTGRGPFDAAVSSRAAPAPLGRSLRAPVPPELEAVVFRALEPDPDARYQTAPEFARALAPFAPLIG